MVHRFPNLAVVPTAILAVLVLSGCFAVDDRPPTNDARLDVAIGGGESQSIAGQPLTLIAYLPGDDDPMDGQGVSWSWSLEYSPTGSNTTVSDPTNQVIELFLDLPGSYLVRVTGSRDGSSGEATQVLEAIQFGPGLQIELSWDIDTSDVDLHLVNLTEGGTFYQAPFDCYYGNLSPQWPPTGPVGNPSLDIDDVDGFGPERIEILEPVTSTIYRVYVHYFSDDGIGPTNATVEARLNDAPLFATTQLLPETDTIWEVADIDGGTGAVTPLDLVYLDTSFGFAPSSKSRKSTR